MKISIALKCRHAEQPTASSSGGVIKCSCHDGSSELLMLFPFISMSCFAQFLDPDRCFWHMLLGMKANNEGISKTIEADEKDGLVVIDGVQFSGLRMKDYLLVICCRNLVLTHYYCQLGRSPIPYGWVFRIRPHYVSRW